MSLIDARGVIIEPGDTAIWGYSSGSCPAMAEGVVMAGERHCLYDAAECTNEDCQVTPVSLTASGRVRVRVTRRSRWGGSYTNPVVNLAPGQLIVLKALGSLMAGTAALSRIPTLPPSPLPTQEDDHA